VGECKPLAHGDHHDIGGVNVAINRAGVRPRQGLTLVHVRAHFEQLQDTFMS